MAVHLITGGSGFVGSNMANMLLDRGENVRVLDLWQDPNSNPDIEYYIGDINDRNLVKHAMNKVDFVHHNVALVPLSKAGKDYWTVNVEGTKTVLEAANDAKVKMFSHMSSSAILDCQKICQLQTALLGSRLKYMEKQNLLVKIL